MVTVLQITEQDTTYSVKCSLDEEDKIKNKYVIPDNTITPKRAIGMVIDNILFEFRLDKLITII